jgi:hypothetical protein
MSAREKTRSVATEAGLWNAYDDRHFISEARTKSLIVWFAQRSLIPAGLATWIIQCGRLLHE